MLYDSKWKSTRTMCSAYTLCSRIPTHIPKINLVFAKYSCHFVADVCINLSLTNFYKM